jgi:hypothetical protein
MVIQVTGWWNGWCSIYESIRYVQGVVWTGGSGYGIGNKMWVAKRTGAGEYESRIDIRVGEERASKSDRH